MEYPTLLPRFLKYVKINSRSDENSQRFPSTEIEEKFQKIILNDLKELGLQCYYNQKSGCVIATIDSNVDYDVPTFGLLAHCDTADFESNNINPQITHNYDGVSKIKLGDTDFYLDPAIFPHLKKYKGQTIISTSGDTLLGGDDKCGVSELLTFAEYLVNHPEEKHGEIKLAFTPDEEIGTGASHFDVEDFGAKFAYTVDGEGPGKLDWGTFSAAQFSLDIQGIDVHPAQAKDKMINAIKLAIDFQNQLPQNEVPEKTAGEEGFYHLLKFDGTVDHAHLEYIIRDFKRDNLEKLAIDFQNQLPQNEVPEKTAGEEGFYHLLKFDGTVDHAHLEYIIRDFKRDNLEKRKELVQNIVNKINDQFDQKRVVLKMADQYYNMADELKKNMEVVDLARNAYKALGLTINEDPVRGGTDGSQLTYMGLPCPNLFAGEENMHGRYEYTVLESMWLAVDVLRKINELHLKKYQKLI